MRSRSRRRRRRKNVSEIRWILWTPRSTVYVRRIAFGKTKICGWLAKLCLRQNTVQVSLGKADCHTSLVRKEHAENREKEKESSDEEEELLHWLFNSCELSVVRHENRQARATKRRGCYFKITVMHVYCSSRKMESHRPHPQIGLLRQTCY